MGPGPDQVDLLDALEERGIQTLGHGIRLLPRYPMDLGVLFLVYCR